MVARVSQYRSSVSDFVFESNQESHITLSTFTLIPHEYDQHRSIGDFAALGIADQAVVASVGGGSTLVANIFVAHFWHGDAVHLTDVCGVVCVIAGAALFAISSSNSTEDEVEAKDLPHHFTAPCFERNHIPNSQSSLKIISKLEFGIRYKVRRCYSF